MPDEMFIVALPEARRTPGWWVGRQDRRGRLVWLRLVSEKQDIDGKIVNVAGSGLIRACSPWIMLDFSRSGTFVDAMNSPFV
jgi:hypothetical protein